MNRQQLIDDIKYIKEVISSSIHYTNLSGIAAIISGSVALIGCFATRHALGDWRLESSLLMQHSTELIAVWLSVFLISAAAHIVFIGRKAKKVRQPAWSHVAKIIVYALSPPMLIGAALTVFLVMEQKLTWIPAIWMICFGLGVWSAGLFSIPEPRWLGASFMVVGVATLFFGQRYSLLAVTLCFGVCHIVYGIRIYIKYDGA